MLTRQTRDSFYIVLFPELVQLLLGCTENVEGRRWSMGADPQTTPRPVDPMSFWRYRVGWGRGALRGRMCANGGLQLES